MIKSREDILNHLEECACHWWRLYEGSYGKNKFRLADFENKDGTSEEGIVFLSTILERCSPGVYTLLYTDSKASGGGPSWTAPKQVPFRIGRSEVGEMGQQAAIGNANMQRPGYSPEQLQAAIGKAVADEKRVWELERQVEDLNAAVKSRETVWERLLENEKVQGLIAGVVQQFLPQPERTPARVAVGYQDGPRPGEEGVAPAECNAEEEGQEVVITEETNQRIGEVINRLLPHYEYDQVQLVSALETLVDKLDENPALKSFL